MSSHKETSPPVTPAREASPSQRGDLFGTLTPATGSRRPAAAAAGTASATAQSRVLFGTPAGRGTAVDADATPARSPAPLNPSTYQPRRASPSFQQHQQRQYNRSSSSSAAAALPMTPSHPPASGPYRARRSTSPSTANSSHNYSATMSGGVTGNSPDEHRRRSQREKQVSFGYVTAGYRNMIRLVSHDPLLKSGGILPLSPPEISRGSKRVWDLQLRKWRRALHMFDYVFIDGVDDEAGRAQVEEQQRAQWVSVAFTASTPPTEATGNNSSHSGGATNDDDEAEAESKTVVCDRVRLPMATLLAARASAAVPTKIPVEEGLRCILRGDSCYEPVRNVVPQTASSLTKGTDISPLEAGIKIHIAPSAAVLQRQREQQQQQQQALALQRQQQQRQREEEEHERIEASASPFRCQAPGGTLFVSPSPARPYAHPSQSPFRYAAAAAGGAGTPAGSAARGTSPPSTTSPPPPHAAMMAMMQGLPADFYGLAPPPPMPSFDYRHYPPHATATTATPLRMPPPPHHSPYGRLGGLSEEPISPLAAAAAAAAMTSIMCSPLHPYYQPGPPSMGMMMIGPPPPPQQQQQQMPHHHGYMPPHQVLHMDSAAAAAFYGGGGGLSVSPSASAPPTRGPSYQHQQQQYGSMAPGSLPRGGSIAHPHHHHRATPETVPRFVTRLPANASEPRLGTLAARAAFKAPETTGAGATAAPRTPTTVETAEAELERSGGSPQRELFATAGSPPGTAAKPVRLATGTTTAEQQEEASAAAAIVGQRTVAKGPFLGGPEEAMTDVATPLVQ